MITNLFIIIYSELKEGCKHNIREQFTVRKKLTKCLILFISPLSIAITNAILIDLKVSGMFFITGWSRVSLKKCFW